LIGAIGLGKTSVGSALVEIWAVSEGGWEDRRRQFRSKVETKIDDIWERFSMIDSWGKSSLTVLFPREMRFVGVLPVTNWVLKREGRGIRFITGRL
jgi:hypothetical protein